MTRVTVLTALVCLVPVAVAFGQAPRGVVYDFTATWCGPCQQMAPIVEKLQREGLPIQKVDVDQQRELSTRFNVQQMPTFILVVDGKEVDRVTGRMTESDLRRMVARVPGNSPGGTGPVASPRTNSSGPISIELGQPAPLVRPTPMQPTREEVRVAEAEPRRGLRDLIPFGRKPDEPPAVVRGNDSTMGGTEQPAAVSNNPPADPMDSSVRIRVVTNGRIDLGSGTLISSQQGISQILTCAHIFKGFTDDSRIEVDVFENGRPHQYLARLIKFDMTSDVGVISIPTTSVVSSTRVASVEQNPKVGDIVAAIGCSGGDEPTRQQSRVTDVDKYEGPHNLLCIGVPVRGRSGGGLFNSRGEVIGVCSAADEQEQRGFYSGLLAIHKLLDQCSLSHLYQQAPPAETQLAATDSAPFARNGDSRHTEPAVTDSPFGATSPFASAASTSAPVSMPATMPVSLPGGTKSNPLDVQAGNAEVVVIIRDPQQPQAPNRVVILHQASPKFLSYLSGELNEGAIDTGNLLGATESQSAPGADWTVRQPSAPVATARPMASGENKQVLQPTTMSSPVVPQKYTRSR